MIDYIVAFVAALTITFFSSPIAKILAVKAGAIDIPRDERRMHKRPIARMGGLAIIIGFLVSIAYIFFVQNPKMLNDWMIDSAHSLTELFGILLGMLIIVTMGILDDIKPLSSKIKFIVQLAVAVMVVFSGTRIQFFTVPFMGPTYEEVGQVISFLLSVFWIVGVTNAINFIDGLDGLAAGVSGIAAVSLCVVASMVGQPGLAIIYIALAGAVMGFLPYNFNPAKIFMGDTGALFLGYILAVLSIEGATKSFTVMTIIVPLIVLGLPIFDTLFAIIRRLIKKRPPWTADRGHIHHRLIDQGISHKFTVTILYVISGALGLVSIVLANNKILPAIILVMVVSAFVVGGERHLAEMLNNKENVKNPGNNKDITGEQVENSETVKEEPVK